MSNKALKYDNIVLIGMPTAGKSTVGVILAKILGMDFIDTDIIIQKREGLKLRQIIEEQGVDGFLTVEENALLSTDVHNSVIATGGSAVYSRAAMEHLGKDSVIIYLKVEHEELKKRLSDAKARGVVLRPGESIDDMFAARSKLYAEFADITISEEGYSIEDTIHAIQEAL